MTLRNAYQQPQGELADRIEWWLFWDCAGRWADETELLRRFGLRERDLRTDGDAPGLLSRFAISRPGGGYCHILRATTAEWLAFRWRQYRAAIRVLVRVRYLRDKRQHCIAPHRAEIWESDTGQGRLLA